MGRKCSVENCASDSTKPEHTGVTFHKVPLHTDVRPKWLSLCHIPEDKNPTKLLYVCSRHFLRADFCSFKGKKYMLRQGVLPSVFPWDKSRLEAIKAEVTSKKDVVVPKKRVKAKVAKKKRFKVVSSEEARVDSGLTVLKDLPVETEIKVEPKVEPEELKVEPKVEPEELKVEPEDFKVESQELKVEHLVEAEESTIHDSNEGIEDKTPDKTVCELDIKIEIKDELPVPVKEDTNNDIDPSIDPFDQHQMSQNTSPASVPINFTINSRIEVLDNNNIWYTAKINEVDYEENEVLIHFEKFPNKCDEWISMTSPRLRPLQPKSHEKFEVGERCMAIWCDSRKFPASVTKKLENDTYEVLFDDGFVKVVKNHKMSKIIMAKPAQSSPLFEPVKGTKQDRRDKKRKLNVAALFHKRPRLSHTEEKKNKGSPVPQVVQPIEEACLSPAPQDETIVTASPLPQWHPTWENGKPVGIESTIDVHDGLRKSIVVPDPRLPLGWSKHLIERMSGNSLGKYDSVIIAPDGKKFRSRPEIKNYLDLHPGVEATIEMFDFSLYRRNHKKKPGKPKKIPQPVEPQPVEPPIEEPPVEEPHIDEEVPEEPPVSLKILFENDAYKCPIEGCGKNFRRENLALMHVKHYHSEYTKYLDSTPNVADLAYARTVGENLDRSPGPPKSGISKPIVEKIPATPKIPKTPLHVPLHTHVEPTVDSSVVPENKFKDSEIIKLLNQKPVDVSSDIQALPSGLPSNMYPDINLKDLLGKSDDIAMRDDIHIKNLCSSRPSQGIKTLLPVRHATQSPTDRADEKVTLKRKRAPSESIEALKGKTPHHLASVSTLESPPPTHQPPTLQNPLQQVTLTSSNHELPIDTPSIDESSIPSAFDLAPPPAELEIVQAPTVTQFDSVIIEGGKIIKLERMKQEEIINCTCGFMEEDGLMIQCELCLCWQHAYCNNIQKESEVPEKYVCYICQHPLRERQSAKYLHDQDWLKQGTLPVASYHSKYKPELDTRFEKLKKCHDLSGGLLELRDYMHTLAVKLKIAEAKNHPKLYLWSKLWEKPKLPEKLETNEENGDVKPKRENDDHEYGKNGMEMDKPEPPNDSMLMMILKSGKEDTMLNMHNNMGPTIPRPEAAINSDDCRLHLLDHIAHGESLVDERLDDFEKQLDALEEGMDVEVDEDYPKSRQTLQLLMRDLDTLKRFSELPLI